MLQSERRVRARGQHFSFLNWLQLQHCFSPEYLCTSFWPLSASFTDMWVNLDFMAAMLPLVVT